MQPLDPKGQVGVPARKLKIGAAPKTERLGLDVDCYLSPWRKSPEKAYREEDSLNRQHALSLDENAKLTGQNLGRIVEATREKVCVQFSHGDDHGMASSRLTEGNMDVLELF